MHPNIIIPYRHLPAADHHQTTIILSAVDVAFLDRTAPRKIYLRTITATLINKFIQTLKQHGITDKDYQPDEFERLLGECVFALPHGHSCMCCGCASTVTVPITNQTTVRDDPRRVVDTATTYSAGTVVEANVTRRIGGGGRRRNNGNSKEKQDGVFKQTRPYPD